jgi:hypothetical protein
MKMVVELLLAYEPNGLFVLDFDNKEFQKYRYKEMLSTLITYPNDGFGIYIWKGEMKKVFSEKYKHNMWFFDILPMPKGRGF